MRIISRSMLRRFEQKHHEAGSALDHWYRIMKSAEVRSFVELRDIFSSADLVGKYVVFNIGGNKYRLRCEHMIELLNTLLDEVGEHQEHQLYPLIETLGMLIEDYETKTLPEPATTPGSVLGFLMAENHLAPGDLPDLGSAQVIDELVNGVREFTLDQIKYLCRRFHVKPELLLAV